MPPVTISDSSSIQTLLSVPELNRFSHSAYLLFESRTLPPIGNFTLP
jgi:hypothetical protein